MLRSALIAALFCLFSPALLAAQTAQTPPAATGDAIFSIDFDSPGAGLPAGSLAMPGVAIESGINGSRALSVELNESALKHVRIPLPVEKLRGKRVTITAMVKARNIAVSPQTYNGIKVLLHTDGPSGKQWEQQNRVWGDFDWKPISHTTRIHDDAREAFLILGLENTTGKVWFDDVRITETKPAFHAGPVFKGHSLPRLRGTMIRPGLSEDDLRHLGGKWNANVIRWQLDWKGTPRNPANRATVAEYRVWLETALAEMDRMLPVCEKNGVMVVVDIHTPPGGRDGANVCCIFQQKEYQDYFPVMWEMISRRYKGNKVIWGYDLVNEPVEGTIPEGLMNWNQLALETAKRVNAIDPDHAIIVEPAPWGLVSSAGNMEKIPLPNIVYSVRMYEPHEFTHQGVGSYKTGVSYPGIVDGEKWDRARVRRTMQKAADFQADYGVHMYLGEFSAIRWAPGDSAYNYIRDVIEIAEEFGWDWTYHAYREWDGWSVEHGNDQKDNKPSATETDRQKLLTGWLAKNQKPALK